MMSRLRWATQRSLARTPPSSGKLYGLRIGVFVNPNPTTLIVKMHAHPNPPVLSGGLLDVVDALGVRHALHQPLHVPAAQDSVRSQP